MSPEHSLLSDNAMGRLEPSENRPRRYNESMGSVAEHHLLHRDAAGALRVGGTRITLDTVIHAFLDGATAEEIAQNYPLLQLADVYELLAFYLNNRSSVDQYLEERRSEAAAVRTDIEARPEMKSFRERLRNRARRGA